MKNLVSFKSKKSIILTILLITSLLLVSIGYAMYLENGSLLNAGIAVRQLLNRDDQEILVIINNDFKITRKDFEIAKILETEKNRINKEIINNDKKMSEEQKTLALKIIELRSDEKILSDMIRKKVQLSEAQKLEIKISDDYVSDLIDNLNERLNKDIESSDEQTKSSAKQTKMLYDSYLKGLEMSEQEYKKEISIPMLKEELTINELQKKYIETLPLETRNDKKLAIDKYNMYVDDLVEDALIIKKSK